MEKTPGRCKPASPIDGKTVGEKKNDGLGFAFAQEQVNTVNQLSTGKRFGDVIIGAEFVAAQNVLVLDFGGQENHRNCGGFGLALESGEHFQTVHLRHHNIENDQVGFLVRQHV